MTNAKPANAKMSTQNNNNPQILGKYSIFLKDLHKQNTGKNSKTLIRTLKRYNFTPLLIMLFADYVLNRQSPHPYRT